MKDAIGTLAGGLDRCSIGNVGSNDLEPPRVAVLLQIGLTTDGKVVDNPYSPPRGN